MKFPQAARQQSRVFGPLSGVVRGNHRSLSYGGYAMLQLRPLDPDVPISEQLGSDASPVVLLNLFQVAEADIPGLLKAWEDDANWMKRQPGYISTQLHRAIGGSNLFLNYAVWESVAHFRAAFNHPDFKQALGKYPSSVVASPHLFSRVAVPNLCTGQ
jgi:heme-degrading monooxygenase HmoA